MSRSEIIVEDSNVSILLSDSGPQGSRGIQVLSGNSNPSSVIGLIGDQYINTSTAKLFGPKTDSGWGEGVTLVASDPENLGQIYNQDTPSAIWDIAHSLSFIPNITVVDNEGNVVEGSYVYINISHIEATFSIPISGSAYLS
jgi:hypothetical protein